MAAPWRNQVDQRGHVRNDTVHESLESDTQTESQYPHRAIPASPLLITK